MINKKIINDLEIYQQRLLGAIALSADNFSKANYYLSHHDFVNVYASMLYKAFDELFSMGAQILDIRHIMDIIYKNELDKNITINGYDAEVYFYEAMDLAFTQNFDYYLTQTIQLINRYRIQKISSQCADLSLSIDVIQSKINESIIILDDYKNIKSMHDLSLEIVEYVDNFLANDESIQKISTGINTIDNLLDGGFGRGKYIVFGARPSVGKTAIAMQIAAHISKNKKVLFFSLEMSALALMKRLVLSQLCMTSNEFDKIKKGDLEKVKLIKEQMEKNKELLLTIDESKNITIEQLILKSKKYFLNDDQNGLIVIDYLQLIKNDKESKFNNRNESLTAISIQLKSLAETLNVPILILSQLRRFKNPKDRPDMSELRDSGQIEQDADVIMLMSRDHNTPPEIQQIIFEVAKNRDGRAFIDSTLRFNSQYFRFDNFFL